MKERPILFTGSMVRALLDGRKTQTRRLVKPQPRDSERYDGHILSSTDKKEVGKWQWVNGELPHYKSQTLARCPYGNVGDRLWVRETFFPVSQHKHEPRFAAVIPDFLYAAEYPREPARIVRPHHWKPSIFCTRAASRITLEVTAVRVERLHDMEGQAPYPGESDALAEGIHRIHHGDGAYYFHAFHSDPNPEDWSDPVDAYKELWESINGAGSWALNPWVWVIEFRRVQS